VRVRYFREERRVKRRNSNNVEILINEYATRGIKVKTELLGRKNGWKIPSIRKPTGGI